VRGLCPEAPDSLESPGEGMEERRIEGGREVVWIPKIYDRSPPIRAAAVYDRQWHDTVVWLSD